MKKKLFDLNWPHVDAMNGKQQKQNTTGRVHTARWDARRQGAPPWAHTIPNMQKLESVEKFGIFFEKSRTSGKSIDTAN